MVTPPRPASVAKAAIAASQEASPSSSSSASSPSAALIRGHDAKLSTLTPEQLIERLSDPQYYSFGAETQNQLELYTMGLSDELIRDLQLMLSTCGETVHRVPVWCHVDINRVSFSYAPFGGGSNKFDKKKDKDSNGGASKKPVFQAKYGREKFRAMTVPFVCGKAYSAIGPCGNYAGGRPTGNYAQPGEHPAKKPSAAKYKIHGSMALWTAIGVDVKTRLWLPAEAQRRRVFEVEAKAFQYCATKGLVPTYSKVYQTLKDQINKERNGKGDPPLSEDELIHQCFELAVKRGLIGTIYTGKDQETQDKMVGLDGYSYFMERHVFGKPEYKNVDTRFIENPQHWFWKMGVFTGSLPIDVPWYDGAGNKIEPERRNLFPTKDYLVSVMTGLKLKKPEDLDAKKTGGKNSLPKLALETLAVYILRDDIQPVTITNQPLHQLEGASETVALVEPTAETDYDTLYAKTTIEVISDPKSGASADGVSIHDLVVARIGEPPIVTADASGLNTAAHTAAASAAPATAAVSKPPPLPPIPASGGRAPAAPVVAAPAKPAAVAAAAAASSASASSSASSARSSVAAAPAATPMAPLSHE